MTQEELQHIREGEAAAYERMYRSYFKKFFNYGRKFTGEVALVEDSIQEVFFDIWNKRSALPGIAAVNSYLFAAFRYVLLRKLRQASQVVLSEGVEAAPDFTIEQKLIQAEAGAERTARLQAALDSITARQREAIFLRFYENLSYEEIAAVMNITTKAAYKIMARSLESLRERVSLPLLLAFLITLSFSYSA